MKSSRHERHAAVVVWLTLALARCSGSGGGSPTSPPPANGTISGIITVTKGFFARPRASLVAAAHPVVAGRALEAPPLPAALRSPPIGASLRTARAPHRSPPAYTANDLLVTFRSTALAAPPLGSAALADRATAQALGGAIRSHLAAIVPAGAEVAGVSPTILTAKIRVADTTRRDAIAAALGADPAVASVTRNGLIWLDETARPLAPGPRPGAAVPRTTPNNPFYPQQSWHYDLIDLPRAWSITTGSAAVLVAVVDNGIRFDHPAIAANLTTDGYDFVNNVDSVALCAGGKISIADDGNGYDPDPTIPASYHADTLNHCYVPDTVAGHGLHVAGTIGAVGNNGIGVTGVNWTVRIRPVRVLGVTGVGESYDVAQGILYAAGLPADNGAGGTVQPAAGAKIINLSLGSSGGDTTLHSAVIAAAGAGALIVAAAGNDSTSAPFYPAAYPEVFAVAAVGPDSLLTFYSNYGSYVGIAAPGGNFMLGGGTSGVASTLWNFATTQPEYGYYEGTSMATPHVAGVAALVLAQTPSLPAAQLRSRLTSYAVPVSSAKLSGLGLVNAYNSLTQMSGPAAQLYARLYSAATGAIVQTVPTQTGGAYSFANLASGGYDVYGGTDEGGDQQLGIPGRLWGAFGGSGAPTSVTVTGAGPYAASFSIGFPAQVEPNQSRTNANVLVAGGYIAGRIVDSTKADWYRVEIPESGSYTFETSGWVGACGFALEEATAIAVFDAVTGTKLAEGDYIDPTQYNYCSRITTTLAQGAYYVGVAGLFTGRRYRLQARAGS